MATYNGLVKLGTLRNGATIKPRPTAPWRGDVEIYTGAGLGNIPKYSNDPNIANWNIGNTDANEANQLYWHKIVDGTKTLLICDRVILTDISWDDLNGDNRVFGKTITIDGVQYKLRLLSGGENNRGTSYIGGTPTNNDWDRFIANEAAVSGLPTPTASDKDTTLDSTDKSSTHNQFWNWFAIVSWTQETFTGNVANRSARGAATAIYWNNYLSSSRVPSVGWRPVLEVLNIPPTLTLTSPKSGSDNLLGTDGNCEDTSKFTYSGGTAELDNTRKTQGNNSLKVTKSATTTTVDTLTPKRIYPSVGDSFIVIADGFIENLASQFRPAYSSSGLTLSPKYVTPTASGYSVGNVGQFVPLIMAVQITAVTTPGVSYLIPKIHHVGTIGHVFNVDALRIYKLTQAEFDTLGTSVNLATAKQIAAQYPYVDPSDNQTLSEGSSYKVEGTASDSDNNNVVTIKYKINNGTTYNAGSGVSNGTTPISFVKNLTYSNKRLRDGATDITGVDLAENTNHTLVVWAEDDQGGKSAEVTRTFTVVWNRPPTISGTDTNLGTISTIPTFNYSVTDPEGNTFTITEYLNGVQTKSFAGVASQNYSITFNRDTWLRLELGVPHQVKVRATDNSGQFSERVFTFTRTETQIAFSLKNAFLCDAKPQRVLVTLDSVVPTGATQLIEVCNNAFDVSPTWEDVTSSVTAGRGHVFTNATKTAANWGINIRFTFNKGTATQPIIVNGYGGAFD